MYKYQIFFLLAFLSATTLLAEQPPFETAQLPLSKELQKTFPEIKSACFIITSQKAGVVLSERNSKEKINTNILPKTLHPTLLGLCCSCDFFRGGNRFFKFHSELGGIGCVFKYTNSNSCEFTCALYGVNSENELCNDMRLIKQWLDQFYLYRASRKGDHIAKIPVFYSQEKYILMKFQSDNYFLISKYCNKNITKTSRYKTMLMAPTEKNMKIGNIFYRTSTFENLIQKPILLQTRIEKSSRWATMLDSIHYVIFGAPFGSCEKEQPSD